jgi:sulfonate transport system substrate-binding protein
MAASSCNRRALLSAGAALGGALWIGGCGQARGDTVLRASTTGKGDSDTELLLRTVGLRPEGFTVSYANFQSGQLVVEALNGGSLDFGSMSEIPPIFAAAAPKLNFRQIAVVHGDVNNQVVLVPKGSPARSIADLKGKRVGYVRATTAQYFLLRMLEEAGLGWDDIQPVALGVSDGASAFAQGALDAWAIYGFPIQRAIATEGARILKTAYGILSGNYLVCAHVDALADPDEVAKIGDYLRLMRRGYAWAATHPREWAKVVADNIGVPLAYVEDQFRRRSDVYSLRPIDAAAIRSQQAVADVFAAQKLIPARVDVHRLWDDRFNAILQEKG